MSKVEDDFLYPIPVGEQRPDSAAAAAGLRLTNSLEAVLNLYQHAGAIPKQRFDPKSSAASTDGGSSEAGSTTASVTKMDEKLKAPWFKYSERVIPGGMMRLVESITIPTPKGWTSTTAARVNQLFDRRFLVEFESKAVLAQFTYTELDELRFAYTAVLDLITGGPEAVSKMVVPGGSNPAQPSSASASAATPSAPPSYFASQTAQAATSSKIFENMWNLQGLAKRDIKKNCDTSTTGGDGGEGSASAAAASPVVVAGKQKVGVAKGGTGSSGLVRVDASKERPKLAAEKKHAKALLEDECAKLWPHTPAAKAAAFTMTQDPNQPRHKPLYTVTVELANMNRRKVEGPPMGNKKDAEDAAAELVLKFLYSSAFKKN